MPEFMRHLKSILLFISLSLTFFSATVSADDDQHKEKKGGSIIGQVVDISGEPLSGVLVTIKEDDDDHKTISATTDEGGMFTLNNVEHEERIVVHFAKEGYVTSQGVASLEIERENDRCEDKHEKDWKKDKKKKHKREHCEKDEDEIKLDQTTLFQTLIKVGANLTVDAAMGGTLSHNGFNVTFAPDSFTTTGVIDVAMTPIDVSTDELNAFPGDYTARQANGDRTYLETFSLIKVDLSQNGQPVNLKPGATADIEFLLPANTTLKTGDTIPLWSFDENRARWNEEGMGTVGVATSDPNRLAVFGTVTHFSWWNCDQPLSSQSCVNGFVFNEGGFPVSGAYVRASGIDYNGVTSATTDNTGRYCIQVKRASTVSITARFGTTVMAVSNSETVATPAVATTCAQGGCSVVPNLTIPGLTCVRGDVRDENNIPVAGVTVRSTGGAFAVTNPIGRYCLQAPANNPGRVFTDGYPSTEYITGVSGASCGSGVCTNADIRKPATESCLRGNLVNEFGLPFTGLQLEAYEIGLGNTVGDIVTTDANGDFCMTGLPPNTDIFIRNVRWDPTPECDYPYVRIYTNSGPAGGSCTSGTCNFLPQQMGYCDGE